MNKLKLYILAGSTLLLSGLSLASCSDDPRLEPDPVTPDAQLPSLTISLGIAGQSRATGSDQLFEKGIGYENYLDIRNNDYRLYFFGPDNKYIATFQPTVIPTVNPDQTLAENFKYVFMGEVPQEMKDIDVFKLVVLANWGKDVYPAEAEEAAPGEYKLVKGQTTIEELTTHAEAQFAALTSPAEGESWLGDDRLIPFYGVRSYALKSIKPENFVDGKIKPGAYFDLSSKSLPLIRAMARIEVILNTFGSFESVKLTKSNARGCSAPYLPTGWTFDWDDYYKLPDDNTQEGLWDANYVKGVHLTAGTDQNDANPGEVQFQRITEEGAIPEVWRAYVPEYKNVGKTDFTTIEVEVADVPSGIESTKTIYFATNGSKEENDKGNREDIKRNNIYRFTITEMTTSFDVKVDIQPFAEQKLTFEFGLIRDNRGDLKVLPIGTDEDGNLIYPEYFKKFLENHKWPVVIDADGNETDIPLILINDDYNDDYLAIVVGEYDDISEATIWLKDSDGCRVLTNFGKRSEDDGCSARTVIDFFGDSQETYDKDKYGDRRVHHYPNHNTIIIHTQDDIMYFRTEPDADGNFKAYEVESWDESTFTGWIILSQEYTDETKTEIIATFRNITAEGVLGDETKTVTIPAVGSPGNESTD